MRRHSGRHRRLWLVDDALHPALAWVQAAFPHCTDGVASDRHCAVVRCSAVRHRCRVCIMAGTSSMHDGTVWTNRSARAMMTAVRHEAMLPQRVSARDARWRPSAAFRRLLFSPIPLTGGER